MDTSNSYAALGKLLGVEALIYVYAPNEEVLGDKMSKKELNRLREPRCQP